MGKQIKCPMNLDTKEMFECLDCPFEDNCIEDMCDDFTKYVVKGATKLSAGISEVLKGQRGI